jgi:hypothetical protein
MLQEVSTLKQKLGTQENEGVRLSQLLDIEKDMHSQTKEELKALRSENKDLIAQKARDSTLVATAEDLRRQWETVQASPPFQCYQHFCLCSHSIGASGCTWHPAVHLV